MRNPGCGAFLLLISAVCEAQSPEAQTMETLLNGAFEHHLSNNRQLLNTLDSSRRLSPFGDLQVMLLAGGGQTRAEGSPEAELSSGELRANGQYFASRRLRVGLDIAIGKTYNESAATEEFAQLSMVTSGLIKSWHWDMTASYQKQDLPYTPRSKCDGWTLQSVAGYNWSGDNRRWHYGPTLGFTLSDVELAGLDSGRTLNLSVPELAAGVFAQFLSHHRTLSLTWNLALQGEMDRKLSGGSGRSIEADPYLTGRINLTYAPNPLARITLQYEGSSGNDRSGQNLLLGVIYHL